MKLTYGDYRPIRQGDKGWTPEKQKARWYYSPSKKESLTYYQFSKQARGGLSYEKQLKIKQIQGYKKKTYKPRKKVLPSPPQRVKPVTIQPVKKPQSIAVKRQPLKYIKPVRKKVRSKNEVTKSVYIERSLFMKNRFTKQLSKQLGRPISFDDLPAKVQGTFWEEYHRLVDETSPPDEDEYNEDFSDFFGEYDDDISDLHYGESQ